MFTSSPTNKPPAGCPNERAYTSPQGRDHPTEMHPIPMPVLTRTATQGSAASCSSSTDLLPHHHHTNPRKNRASIKARITSWYAGPPHTTSPNEGDAPPAVPVKKERLKPWHGWRHVLFGSCMCSCYLHCIFRCLTMIRNAGLNVFMLLLPVSVRISDEYMRPQSLTDNPLQWILKLTTNGDDTLVFTGMIIDSISRGSGH